MLIRVLERGFGKCYKGFCADESAIPALEIYDVVDYDDLFGLS